VLAELGPCGILPAVRQLIQKPLYGPGLRLDPGRNRWRGLERLVNAAEVVEREPERQRSLVVPEEILSEIARKDGEEYQDLRTPYGDMSRLVVAWLARQSPKELADLYNDLGWEGHAGSRAFHEAAKRWMEKYQPERLPVTS